MDQIQLAPSDWVVIGIYFAICHLISIFVKFRRKTNTLEENFLAGRSMVWIVVACSLFASNVGTEHFIGVAGSAAANGIAVIAYEWHAVWVLLLLGFLFMPIYINSEVYTVPEYLKSRFQSKGLGIYLAVICVINSFSTKIAIDVYAGGIFLKQLVNYNIYLSSFVLLSFTAIYTLIGGLTSVMYIDTMQCAIMICGSVVISIIGLHKVGGVVELWTKFPLSVGKHVTVPTFPPIQNSTVANVTMPTIVPTHNTTINTSLTTILTTIANVANTTAPNMTSMFSTTTSIITHNSTTPVIFPTTPTVIQSCYNVSKDWDHLFRPVDDNEYPWPGIVLSLPITAIWYWCTDQVIVQRAMTSKNLLHAQRGTIFAGFLKLLPLFIMIIPGMIARVLFPDIIACPDSASCKAECDNEYGCTHLAYFQLVTNILPHGVIGLMFAMMLAALMSSISATFIGVSTVFTMDIWKVIRKDAKDGELLWVGRIVIIAMVIVGTAWIPIVESVNQKAIFTYLQNIQSYIAPSVCAVFLMGMLFTQPTEAGALSSLLMGAIIAIIRFSLDIAYPPPQCGHPDNRPLFVKLHFMYFSIILFVLSIICICLVSICTQPVPRQLLGKLTWRTINEEKYQDDDDNYYDEIGMDNTQYRHSRGDISDKNYVANTETSEGRSNFEVWEMRITSGTLLIVLISLCIYFR